MNKDFKVYFLWTLIIGLSICSCTNRIDNYELPNASIYGALLDIKTGDTVPTANNTQAFGTVILMVI